MNRTNSERTALMFGALAAIVAISLVLPMAGCKRGKGSGEKNATSGVVPVEVEPLKPVAYQRHALAVATAEPWRQVTLRAEAAGRVLSLKADVGSTVKRGALLARLDGSVSWRSYKTAKVSIQQAEVSLRKAKLDLKRAKGLRATDDYSQAQLDQAQSVHDSAKAAVKLARAQTAQAGQQLSNFALRAPFAGTISLRAVEVGDYASPGAAVFTLVDASKLKVVVGLSPSDGLTLKAGASATVKIQTADGRANRAARVHVVRPVVDSATRRVEVELSVDNADGTLKPGVIVDVEIPVGAPTPRLLVPQGAVVERTGQHFVYVVRKGAAVRLEVSTGLVTRDRMEIRPSRRTPVQQGDQLVVLGLQRLVKGTRVNITGRGKGAQAVLQTQPSR